MMKLPELFLQNWAKHQFGTPENTFLVAVSGGIDSMVLAELCLRSGIKFCIAHCNFQLRGEESDKDEQLVTNWCATKNIKLHTIKFDTKRYCDEWKKGTQETARILRYEWFEEIRKKYKYAKIATAHHANDNVETMFINLFKGTGLAGIHGILPISGAIIRPLLFAKKEDLNNWAAENNISYREDASNATDDYLRNAVRRNLLPVIEQWFPGAVTQVNASIEHFREAEILYRKAIEQERKKLIGQRSQDFYIPILKLQHREPLNTICYELLHPFGFSSGQIPQVISLLSSESGHYVNSATHRIIRNRDFLIITTLPSPTADLILIESVPCIVETAMHKFFFSIADKPKQIDTNPNIALIDLKNIEFPIILRKWKTGDYFYPIGMNMKKKKVSRVLINEKIALHEKENIHVLECEQRILWLAGIRLDERFKIKENTEKVLVVKMEKVK